MYISILFLPLLGFLSNALFGHLTGRKGSVLIPTISMFLTAVFSILVFIEVTLHQSPCYIRGVDWVQSDLFTIQWGFMFDSLTATMLVVVTSISFLVHLYSSEYMSLDPHLPRFMSYLSFFTFFMIILVTADNFVQLFMGWEGVGLCSYLLINFWSTRLSANKSALKAMVVNRIGDLGFCLGIFLVVYLTGSAEFNSVFASAVNWIDSSIYWVNSYYHAYTVIAIFLFIGAVGKSAQIGLHTWLPDAMEGPTPVSALIHAATMVTAGVFLILRCSILFEFTSTGLLVITFVGAMTAFFAATIGVFQNDLKKVIAYSTCSQLGYMVFICGLSGYSISIYHLANHAFFKALLFLSAGAIIHAVSDEQDMRKMGGFSQLLPYCYSMVLIGSLSLMGFPFLTGFYSKDFILETAYSSYQVSGHFAFWLGSLAAFLTSFYSIRLLYLTFIATNNSSKVIVEHVHEAPIRMALPLGLLAVTSIFIGYFWRDMFIGPATHFWNNSLFILPTHRDLLDAEWIPTMIKLCPVIFSLSGGLTSLIVYHMFRKNLYILTTSNLGVALYKFFNQKWYFDSIYNHLITKPALLFGGNTSFKLIDKGFLEMFGPYGIAKFIYSSSKQVSSLQTGWIHHSVLIFLVGITFFILLGNSVFVFFNEEWIYLFISFFVAYFFL